jgi:receptor protein-tyrosine kinase
MKPEVVSRSVRGGDNEAVHPARPGARLGELTARVVSNDRTMEVRAGDCEEGGTQHGLARPGECLRVAHDPYHPRSERVRMLRTELLLRREAHGSANMVALLSPCSGEGRSLLAAELAIAFARLGQATLLVDADLRNPQQHVLFETSNRYGLSQALARHESPYLHEVEGVPELSLLTAGPTPTNPLELLSDRHLELMIDGWRKDYGFVVFDTAPINQYFDGLAVALPVGRVLTLSRAGRTPLREMREMLRRLASTRSRILGAVISHF